MRLATAIQHHPRRAGLLPALLDELIPLDVDVVTDPDPDGPPQAWRTYRAALEATPPWASHRLILQDDVEVCARFPETVELVLAGMPDRLLCLCVCGTADVAHRVLRAQAARARYMDLIAFRWVSAIATVWPVELIGRVLEWVDAQRFSSVYADDELIGRAAMALGIMPAACVPSIVEHPDREETLIGIRKPRAGGDRGRVAAVFDRDAFEFWRPSRKLDSQESVV